MTNLTPADCEPEAVSGDIETDTTWEAADCPRVALDGNVRVTNGATLTIEPGVEVIGRSGARLTVKSGSTLASSGGPENPVWFYGDSDTPGYWQWIRIHSTTANEIDNAVVRNGGANDRANLYLRDTGRVSVTNSLFEGSATSGLVADAGTTLAEFSANEFRGNGEYAVNVPTTLVGSVDADSTYAGGNTTDAVRVFSRDVESDATWSAVPCRFDGGNHRRFAPVTVDPGAQFTFGEGARVTVREGGSLTAEGTTDSQITFEGPNATPGHWQDIRIHSTDPANSFQHVVVAHGLANSYLTGDAQGAVTNTTLRQSATWGLYVEDSATVQSPDNLYENNNEGGIRTPEA